MNTGQIQLRLTLTDRLYEFLQGRASRLGIPVTQMVKYMIIEKAQLEEFPTFRASTKTEQAYSDAMKHIDQAIEVKDVGKYLDSL